MAGITFYGAAKATTTLFLVERARLVYSPHLTRRQNKLYLFNMSLLTGWGGLIIAAILKRSAFIRPDGQCLIGLGQGPSTWPFRWLPPLAVKQFAS